MNVMVGPANGRPVVASSSFDHKIMILRYTKYGPINLHVVDVFV